MNNNIASDFLVNIFKKFKKNSIEYVILRNYEKLPYDNDSKDVDILIKACTIDNTFNLILKEFKIPILQPSWMQYGIAFGVKNEF